jgi:MoaA/NifB/PqqE/SkfB family radical SAM enzyme
MDISIFRNEKIIDDTVITVPRPASYQITRRSVVGRRQKIIKAFMWVNILFIAIKKSQNLFIAIKEIRRLRRLRNEYRNQKPPFKYSKVAGKYYVSYNTPAWPSKAFNRYVVHLLNRFSAPAPVTLNTLVFAITKKCGFQCEHCCEWDNLNKPEVLSKQDLLSVTTRFQQLGVSQVQLSGGEPLNRFKDILFLLDHAHKGTDFWLYTTGYQLTHEKAFLLKQHGLRGITISIDHYEEDKHDQFRGKQGAFRRALAAAQYANEAGLAVCFSLCATKEFVNTRNLTNYADMAKNAGAAFIQILEPKAVGHYANKPVALNVEQQKILELFFEKMNYDQHYAFYPIVTYHGYYSRRVGCSGSGKDYLYVDTDGDIHNCPFCQRKLFSALGDDLVDNISNMKNQGCAVYSICSTAK